MYGIVKRKRGSMAKGNTTYGKADKQTSYVSGYLGVPKTARSGATLNGGKGDLQDEFSLFECKTTMSEKSSFSVKKEWLTKANKERVEERRQFSFLVINFGGLPSQDNHVVMSLEDFRNMYNVYKEHVRDDDY